MSDAAQLMEHGNYSRAIEIYTALLTQQLDAARDAQSLLGLGRAHLRDGDYTEAAAAFRELRVLHRDDDTAHDAAFLLGEALMGSGQSLSATVAYSDYLEARTVITPYVYGSMGEAFQAAGVYTAAVGVYEKALVDAPDVVFESDVREKLALTHAAVGNYEGAVDQYDAILQVAKQPTYRARIEHQAAETLLLAGAFEEGYDRHLALVQTYPTEEHAYLSLVKLVEAGRPVDDFLRGKVDYYGEAYGPAVAALYRYIRAYPETHIGDAHWYAGLAYWEAGNPDLAVEEFRWLIDTHPSNHLWGDAWLKLAELQTNQGDTDAAVETYRAFVDAAPDHPLAPEALWEAAKLLERTGRGEEAAPTYLDCQASYPSSDLAPLALLRSGLQFYQLGQDSNAVATWATLTEKYPDSEHRPAALLWLGKIHLAEGDAEKARDLLEEARAAAPRDYYGLRSAALAMDSGQSPFETKAYAPSAEIDNEDEAEAWLVEWLALESHSRIDEAATDLATDPRLQRGLELWRLDRFQEAKRELELLRRDTSSDPVRQYHLAQIYSDVGLYRSSIICAWQLIDLSPVTKTLDAPDAVLRLAYPTYYEDLVLESAQETGLAPLLLFSQIRQESLFESLATSSASAQGLMQVIPPTGAEIAADLDWPPGYETADLYRPYVSLRFGAHYLSKQRDRFAGRMDVALAAYNGGPYNAQRWLERAGEDPDLFLETITFGETRRYLQLITEHLAIYEALYSRETNR